MAAAQRRSPRRRRSEIEPDKQLLPPREVPYEAAQRQRKPPDQGGHREDLVARREDGLLVDIDHVEVEAPREVLLADRLDVRDGAPRLRGRAGHVQAQDVALRRWLA